MHTWRLSDTSSCDCGDVQTADHLVEDCPIHRLDGGWNALQNLTTQAKTWLRDATFPVIGCTQHSPRPHARRRRCQRKIHFMQHSFKVLSCSMCGNIQDFWDLKMFRIAYSHRCCDLTQRASVSMHKCADWVNLKFVSRL